MSAANPLHFSNIKEIQQKIVKGQLSAEALVDSLLTEIDRLNPILKAYIKVIETARVDGRFADQVSHKARTLGNLHGVALSLKDIILTRGTSTTAGSKLFDEGVSGKDALLVKRLRRAGAIFVGKTNLHEFACGMTSENPHFGAVRNPWNQSLIAGGSSGGSAVAVATGLCYGSVGTDTRGSIRIPSACCGITGLKPTFGLVPTKGVIPLSWTLDHAGPMARSVEDVARLLQALVGNRGSDYLSVLDIPPTMLRVAWCDYYFERLDSEVRDVVQEAKRVFESLGIRIERVHINHLNEALDASETIFLAEAIAYHDRCLQEKPEYYGVDVRKRLEAGYLVSGMDYVRAQRVRLRMKNEFKKVFRKFDCLIAPTLPCLPPPRGQDFININGKKELILKAFARFNAPQNVGGVPALTMNAGMSRSGLPIGIQLIAGHYREEVLFRLGSYFQRHTDWHLRYPPRIF